MTVAESIRYLMDQRGWTVADLTRASGVARSTIDNMFSRGTGITNSTLEAIAEAFGLTAVQVLSMGNAMVELTPEQQEFFMDWAALTGEQNQIVAEVVRQFHRTRP